MAADPRWYEQLDGVSWHEEAWRDPWVFRGPDGSFHALITARVREGPPDGRGVIGHARSDDLVSWEMLPPVSEPGDFGHLEVPQLVSIDGRHYLTFSVDSATHSMARVERGDAERTTGVFYRMARWPLGPFTRRFERVLLGDDRGSFYTGKFVEAPTGGLAFISCRAYDDDGSFVGELSDPFPVTVDRSGELRIDVAAPEFPGGEGDR
jgi:beta-fructofuranosidase